MKYKIVAVGKIKESYYKDAISEYVKRLSKFANVEIVETDEFLFNGAPNESEKEKIVTNEGKLILQKVEGFVVAMDIGGKEVSSEDVSRVLSKEKQSYSSFTFVIGGSYGLSDEVKKRANAKWSFGKITLPHRLFRVVLCEQLYRACCIENNIPYHK